MPIARVAPHAFIQVAAAPPRPRTSELLAKCRLLQAARSWLEHRRNRIDQRAGQSAVCWTARRSGAANLCTAPARAVATRARNRNRTVTRGARARAGSVLRNG